MAPARQVRPKRVVSDMEHVRCLENLEPLYPRARRLDHEDHIGGRDNLIGLVTEVVGGLTVTNVPEREGFNDRNPMTLR